MVEIALADKCREKLYIHVARIIKTQRQILRFKLKMKEVKPATREFSLLSMFRQ